MSSHKELAERVMGWMRHARPHPAQAGEIAEALELGRAERKLLPRVLVRLVSHGDLVLIRKHCYSLGEPVDLRTGRLDVARSGDGFLAVEEAGVEPEVFVPAQNLGTALPGDRVVVRLERSTRDPKQRPAGRVIEVLERGRPRIVGTLRTTGRFFYAVPLDPAYKQDFYVPDPGAAEPGDRVELRFTRWENKHVNPEAEVVSVIGSENDPAFDTRAVMLHYGYDGGFEPAAVEEARRAADLAAAPGERLDLRGELAVTIDPVAARDFDDALSLSADEGGRTVLGVHIADVSHFVRPGGALDREAMRRGNSVYFPDMVIPMLPPELSNGICSLRPDEDRLAFSALLTLDEDGAVAAARFARSIIRSRCRLTYEQAMRVLRDEPPGVELPRGVPALLRRLSRAAQRLRERRFAAGALDMDVGEIEVVLGERGEVADIRKAVSDPSHQLVEECMVAANEAVDLALTNNGYPILHRIHEPPSAEKIEQLSGHLADLGLRAGDLRNRRNMAALLASVAGAPMAYHVRYAVLRSMMKAAYSEEARGHFGLAKTHYCHFTSPIRRYADLVVHRVLAAAQARERPPYTKRDLHAVAAQVSETEDRAEDAERALEEIKKFRFLLDQLRRKRKEPFRAVVVRVTNFGLFVELPDLQVQGLVHISTISRDLVRFDPFRGELRAGHRVFRTATELSVVVVRVNMEKRQADFAVVQDGAAPVAQQPAAAPPARDDRAVLRRVRRIQRRERKRQGRAAPGRARR